jgi:hypothetical protein
MKRSSFLIAVFGSLFLFGCAGYKLGGSQPKGIKTVYVEPIVNKSGETAIEIQAMAALRQRIQFDGRTTLVNKREDADGIISVTLTGFSISAIAFRKDQKTTAEQYRLRVKAISKLTDRKTQKVLSESDTYGETVFSFQSDLTTSKRNAVPQAMQELSKFILDDLLERW